MLPVYIALVIALFFISLNVEHMCNKKKIEWCTRNVTVVKYFSSVALFVMAVFGTYAYVQRRR